MHEAAQTDPLSTRFPRDETTAERAARFPGEVPIAAAVAAFAAAVIYVVGRGTTFYYDEWSLILFRRGWGISELLEPHNEHLSLVPVLVYKLLFATVGLTDYGPYKVALLVFHVACCALVYVLLRRRVGVAGAAAAGLLLLLLGSSYPLLLWPIHVGYIGSLVGGLAMMIGLDRRNGPLTAGGLAFSLASSSFGVPMAVGGAVELLLTRQLARLWSIAAPSALYAVWFAVYGKPTHPPTSNLVDAPVYVAKLAATAVGGIAGVGHLAGAVLAVVALAAAARRLRRTRRVTPRLVLLVCTLISFWVLAAFARADLVPATDPKFVYPSAVLLVLAAAEVAEGLDVRGRLLAAGAVAVALALASNVVSLVQGADRLRTIDARVAAELGAVEIAGANVRPDFQPDTVDAPQITAGPYLAAVRALGSPADDADRLASRPARVRAAADVVLQRALGVQLAPAGATATTACKSFALGPAGVLELAVPRGGLVVRARDEPVAVRLRRFSSTYPSEPVYSVRPRSAAMLALPASGPPGWRARVSGGSGAQRARSPASARCL
jgi:hypothetical protein